MDEFDSHSAEKRRNGLASYLLVGLVGAIIGGFLVVGIAPQILVHRALLAVPSSTSPVVTTSQPETPVTSVSNPIDTSDIEDPWDIVVAVSEKVSPAVVGIVNQAYRYDYFGRKVAQDSSGTGLIVTADGYIVTNNHVVEAADSLMVFLYDGRTLPAKVIGTDPATDLAVIKVEASGLPIGVIGNSDSLKPGQLAIAIGNPLGMEFSRTVTQGVVSGLDRVLSVGDYSLRLIQTDAVVNPGNSGGPLINANGLVIGLTSAKISADAVEGMSFAIPANLVKRVANEIMATGSVRRAMVGVRLLDKANALQYGLDIRVDKGLYVHEAISGGPAAKAGLRTGDFILEVNGVVTDSFTTFQALLAEWSPGDEVTLKIQRGSEQSFIKVTLGEATV